MRISARTRLAVTLRYMATGDSYTSLEYLTRISKKTISKFVPEVLDAIFLTLAPTYLKFPTSTSEWQQISEDFLKKWNFPHVIGAIDGRHVRIVAPPNSGSDFYNYKGFFSVVLLAIVDANSNFLYVNVGANGRASDNVIFKNTKFYEGLMTDKVNIPHAEGIDNKLIPYFLIGDDIFALNKHVMKAFSRNIRLTCNQENYNYRISRGRMTVEVAFGRLVNRFRIFHRPIDVSLPTIDKIIKTACVLHNFIQKKKFDDCSNLGEITTPNTVIPLPATTSSENHRANEIRDYLCDIISNDECTYLSN